MTEPQRTMTIHDFLTAAQIRAAVKLWARHGDTSAFINAVVTDIIHPNIDEINRKIGQENHERYLAYAIQYVFVQSGKPPS